VIEEGQLRRLGDWPVAPPQPAGLLERVLLDGAAWPWVEIVTSHAGAGAALVDALVARGVAGIVVAATGNGTVHQALLAGLLRAQAAGVRVLRASRCAEGRVMPLPDDPLPGAGSLSPVKARIALQLELLSLPA